MKTSKWIRDRRALAGLTQAELGRKVGASQPMISLWERGATEPPPDMLKKLRTVLDGNSAPRQSQSKPAPRKEEAGEIRKGDASPRRGKAAKNSEDSLEGKLWAAADRLRGHMDPADYKYVVLGLIFLKYISDAFEELHDRLVADPDADPEERDHYLAETVFWVPREARWSNLKTRVV